MIRTRFFALACSLALLLTACGGGAASSSDSPSPSASAARGEALPGRLSSFTATDLEGNALDQSMLEGYDLTMVNVWATFCGPCIKEMPDLGKLAEEYREKGVQIVGLVSDTLNSDGTLSDSQVELARDIVDQTGADYPHILPSPDLFGILSQISAVPTTFFVDCEGNQVGVAFSRSLDRESWIQVIDEHLAEVGK